MSRTRSVSPVVPIFLAAFLLVHVLVAWMGWVYPSQPMGDVVLVYDPWSRDALAGGAIVGVDVSWVYPQLALLPMLAAQGIASVIAPLTGAASSYLVAWIVQVTILDLIAFALLLGRGRARSRLWAAAFWVVALLALGPIALYRIDAVTVPLGVLGALWLVGRPRVAAVLLTVGAWIKIWPGVLIAAGVVLLRQRLTLLIAGAGVSVLVALAVVFAGGGAHLLGFLTEQGDRGLQVEAVAATPFLWMAAAGSAVIAYDFDILTFQVSARGVDQVASLLTPLLVLGVVGLLALAAWRVRGGASALRLLPPLVLALATALIVCNKVGSPQFQTWLLAPVVLWIVWDRRRALVPAILVLVLCALTCVVYPLTYDSLLRAEWGPILVLSARNVLLVVLLVVSVRRMVQERSPLLSNQG
ncbi:hypothetical protein ACWIBQ_11405 [Microbacterium keratanolyticum]